MSDALREAREYRDPTCPICEGEGCQCPGEETITEGFKSAAQRRAAFASGYKAKGKKKKEETEAEELEEKFTSAQIKQAYGILNDPRYKQGNYSGAVNVINKIAPGLADHPDVKNALKRANEELEEGMVKRVMQTVHDKLSKEGGAAGFDDLAKVVKKEFGINISKDTLKNMPGVKQHRDGDFILEETEQLDEFTRADFAKLEADNEHGEAAKKLVQKFGTPEEKKEIDAINKRHKQTGYIKGPDYQRRYQITNKYYSRLR